MAALEAAFSGGRNGPEGAVVEGEEFTSNFIRSFGEAEKLFEILENWNNQLNKVEPKFEIVGPPTSDSGAGSSM